jgi:hypothetical protein
VAKADISALLALGAALFIAIGDVIHQRSTHEVTDAPVGHLELFRRLRASGGSAQLRLGAAGAGVARQLAAVRAADKRENWRTRSVSSHRVSL